VDDAGDNGSGGAPDCLLTAIWRCQER